MDVVEQPVVRSSHNTLAGVFVLKRLHSLAGVSALFLFLIGYFYSNAKALSPDGVQAFNAHQKFLADIPFLPVFEFVFIFVPLVFHVFYSFLIFYRGQGNFWQYPYAGNVRYTLHRVAGVIGFLFLAYHFLFVKLDSVLSGTSIEYLSRVHLFEAPDGVLAYLIGGTALFYYFASCLCQASVSWGVTINQVSQSRAYRWSLVLFGLLALVNFLIVMNYRYHYEAPTGWIGILLKLAKTALFR